MQRNRILIVGGTTAQRKETTKVLLVDPRVTVVGGVASLGRGGSNLVSNPCDVIVLDTRGISQSVFAEFDKLISEKQCPPVVVMGNSDKVQFSNKGKMQRLATVDGGAAVTANDDERRKIEFINTVLSAAEQGGARSRHPRKKKQTGDPNFIWNQKMVLIGASTGGVDALECILKEFPANAPPTAISQHMPAKFLDRFAERIDRMVAPRVVIAENGQPLEQGHVYLAPGGRSHLRIAGTTNLHCEIFEGPAVSGHWPSVDVLFSSGVPHADRVVAGLLTGMGRDGAAGLLKLRSAGAQTLIQDQKTSVVFGMPRIAEEMGAAELVLPLGKIAAEVLRMTSRSTRERKPS